MKMIIEGPDLASVIQENRLRVEWGKIKFTPLSSEDEAKLRSSDVSEQDIKDASLVDVKSAPAIETKTPRRTAKSKV